MTQLPRHPDASDAGAPLDVRPTAKRSSWVFAIVAIVVALVILMIVLHVTGAVGPGAHG